MTKLMEGDKAISFNLQNQNGNQIKIEDYIGHSILLWWYPKADTPG